MNDPYQDSLAYLYDRLNYEWVAMPRVPAELRLSRMRRLMRALGDPHVGLKVIHVAGTKGKGSTAVMIASALTAAGIRTGLYTSPHLHRLEERYRIDGQPVSQAEMIGMVDEAREPVRRLERDDPVLRHRGLTFFEIATALGFMHFARRRTQAVVLEVGLGGRLDSTNVVHPVLSMITSIGFDHTRQLGNTLALIAGEKAGIIKRSRPAVCGVVEEEPRTVIRNIARSRQSQLRELGVDFGYEASLPTPPIARPTPGSVHVRTWRTDWGRMELPLLGLHQAHNAAVALAGLDLLGELEPSLEVGRDQVVSGFASLRWPARVEVRGEAPWLVIDGAHNVTSAEALARTLKDCFPETCRTLVFGTSRDKDLAGQLRALCPLFDNLIATRYVENPRFVAPEAIAAAMVDVAGRSAMIAQVPAEALELASRLTPRQGLICVTGSLFLAAEARAVVLAEGPARVGASVIG